MNYPVDPSLSITNHDPSLTKRSHTEGACVILNGGDASYVTLLLQSSNTLVPPISMKTSLKLY